MTRFVRPGTERRIALLVAGALLGVAALVGLALAIERSHDNAREDAVARLAVRSDVSARLLAGTLALSTTQAAALAQDAFGGPTVTEEALAAFLRKTNSQAPYSAILDDEGRELATSPAGAARVDVPEDVLEEALDGHGTTTGATGAGDEAVVTFLIPFESEAEERRVLVSTLQVDLARGFLAGTLADAAGSLDGGALVLDDGGTVLAGVGDAAERDDVVDSVTQAITTGADVGGVDGDRFAIEPVNGTGWQLALVAPEQELLAAVPNPLWPRLALVAFAGMLALVTLMLLRAIRSARHLDEARREAVRANEAKSRFIAHMSHEFKQPLAAVMGFSDILVQRPELGEADKRHFVSIIARSGRSLEELVNELLDISRIESGHVVLNMDAVDLDLAVGDAIAIDEAIAADRRITVEYRNECPDGVCVVADPMRLRQVLLNLLSNAVKYNREGGSVLVEARMTGAASVTVSVTDEGNGIAPDDLGRLFQPFERLREHHGTVAGTGLGLVITKGLVEAMDGSLDVRSAVGRGSTFSFVLEAAYVERGDGADADSSTGTAGVVDDASIVGRVLYIEDVAENRELVATVLGRERPGLAVTTAPDGERGVELARAEAPDILLLDLNLPGISGEQVLRRIRSHSDTTDIPVIVMSSDSSSLRVTQLLATGADAYITKPIDVRRLVDTIDVLMRRHAQPRDEPQHVAT